MVRAGSKQGRKPCDPPPAGGRTSGAYNEPAPGLAGKKLFNTARGTPAVGVFAVTEAGVTFLKPSHRAVDAAYRPAFRAPRVGQGRGDGKSGAPGAEQTIRAMAHVCA